jgi:hypothetical protein
MSRTVIKNEPLYKSRMLDEAGKIKEQYIKRYENGTSVLEMPKIDKNGNIIKNTMIKKTLYPENWGREQVIKAVNAVKNNPNSKFTYSPRHKRFNINGKYQYIHNGKQVEMTLEIAVGEGGYIITAFPIAP